MKIHRNQFFYICETEDEAKVIVNLIKQWHSSGKVPIPGVSFGKEQRPCLFFPDSASAKKAMAFLQQVLEIDLSEWDADNKSLTEGCSAPPLVVGYSIHFDTEESHEHFWNWLHQASPTTWKRAKTHPKDLRVDLGTPASASLYLVKYTEFLTAGRELVKAGVIKGQEL